MLTLSCWQIPDFGEKGLVFFHDCTRKYPKLYTLWIGPARPSLTVCHPDTCKVVLKSTLPKPVSGMGGYTFLTPWLGKQAPLHVILFKYYDVNLRLEFTLQHWRLYSNCHIFFARLRFQGVNMIDFFLNLVVVGCVDWLSNVLLCS